jgi:hypothetical protein
LSALLTTALLAAATLLFAIALLALTFLSITIRLLSGLLSGTARLAWFVWIVLCFHITFRYIINYSLG